MTRSIQRQKKIALKTKNGKAIIGDSCQYMANKIETDSVDLIITSPPFGLITKKAYGNEPSESYVEWFRLFGHQFYRILKQTGSLIIDIGGTWEKGKPTRSLYHYELLIMLCKEVGFNLAQEFYWWNPSKLPSPAEWVNIRRIRVKDAVNCVWWLSKTPYPKASNRRVLQPYSSSMHDLLENGYDAKKRPSGHDISDKFSRNNSGAIPPNLIAIANTESNSSYQKYCRVNGLKEHPARFPADLPGYFIRMLTDVGDLVLDPFAGSCVTGSVAEDLDRKWICCELRSDYIEGAKGRFLNGNRAKSDKKNTQYAVQHPFAILPEKEAPLVSDGGRKRPERGRDE